MLTYIQSQINLLKHDKSVWVSVFIIPFLITVTVIITFSELIGQKAVLEQYPVGYQIQKEGKASQQFESLKEEHIKFIQMNQAEGISQLNHAEIFLYVTFDEATYTIYMPKYYRKESLYCKGILEQGLAYGEPSKEPSPYLSVQALDLPYVTSSSNYYAIVETACSMCFCIFVGVYLEHLERKNKLQRRIYLGAKGFIERFVARWLTISLVATLQATVFIAVGILSFRADWGQNHTYLPFLLILFEAIVIGGIGANVSYLFTNFVVGNVVWFVIWFVFTFLGGGYQSYISVLFPEQIKALSPLYYIDRGIIELVYKGEYTYITKAFCVLFGIMGINLLLFLVNCLLYRRRRYYV